jgi:hypothetical protein|tara:strand:+ start:643 stop:846 length:204 start_codon:yes stop_codon:yes gene_type:complete
MSLREQLRRNKTLRGRRWTVKRDSLGKLVGVKMIYNPEEYVTYSTAKPMVGDKALLKILDKEFINKN